MGLRPVKTGASPENKKEKTGDTVLNGNEPDGSFIEAALTTKSEEELAKGKSTEAIGMNGDAIGIVMSLTTGFGGVAGLAGTPSGPSVSPVSATPTRQADEVPMTAALATTMRGLATAVQSGNIGDELKVNKAQAAPERSPGEVKADAKNRMAMAEKFLEATKPQALEDAMENTPVAAAPQAVDPVAAVSVSGLGTDVTFSAPAQSEVTVEPGADKTEIPAYKPEPSLAEQTMQAVNAPVTKSQIDMARVEIASMAVGGEVQLKLGDVAAYREIAQQIKDDAKELLGVQQVRVEKGVEVEGGDVASAAFNRSYADQMRDLLGTDATQVSADQARQIVTDNRPNMARPRVSGMNA